MRVILIVVSILVWATMLGCEKSRKKPKKSDNNGVINKILGKNIDAEYTDSLAIESFVESNPSYRPYTKKLQKFYSRRNYELAWSEKGEYLPQASMFINLLRFVSNEGMDPDLFGFHEMEDIIENTHGQKKDSLIRKKLDLELTGSYFKYSNKLWHGKIDPEKNRLEWFVDRKKIKYGKTLDSILDNNEETNPFLRYAPMHPEFQSLSKHFRHYRELARKDGWPVLDSAKLIKLRKGDTSQVIQQLKQKLINSGDLTSTQIGNEFDKKLENALINFQSRSGLETSGKLTSKTIQKLNTPAIVIAKQILVNMERWKWVPDKIDENFLFVNIPEFKLKVFEKGEPAHEMRVIVGKELTHTPVFNDRLEYVVFNPYWNVPESIAIDEMAPAQKKDSTFLIRMNVEVFPKYDFEHPLNPDSINWDSVEVSNFPYQFRQKPGKGNALGKVKFLFPNNFEVYLHDTPGKHLFSKDARNFSHGCIRIEDPEWLANYLLEDKSKTKLLNDPELENKWFKIPEEKRLPVYIVYFTAWEDQNGRLNLRDDIYGHDKKMATILFEEPNVAGE